MNRQSTRGGIKGFLSISALFALVIAMILCRLYFKIERSAQHRHAHRVTYNRLQEYKAHIKNDKKVLSVLLNTPGKIQRLKDKKLPFMQDGWGRNLCFFSATSSNSAVNVTINAKSTPKNIAWVLWSAKDCDKSALYNQNDLKLQGVHSELVVYDFVQNV